MEGGRREAAGGRREGEEQEECFDGRLDQVTKEPIYVNVNSKKLTNPIQVEDLQAFITKARQNDYEIMKADHRVSIPKRSMAKQYKVMKDGDGLQFL